jgi:hypothetical protein
MPARGSLLRLCALYALTAFALRADAGEKVSSTTKRLTRAPCEQLIRQLVYPGKPPFKKAYVFPEELDEATIRAKQSKVEAAYDKLSANVETALPVLVKYARDERFSYVYEDAGTSGVYVKATVGYACWKIIEAHVEVYRREVTRSDFASISRCPSFIGACGGVDKWWKSRKDKSLAELQLEGIEWALRQEKPKLFESDQDWAQAKKALEKMATSIRTSNKPILIEHHIHTFGR